MTGAEDCIIPANVTIEAGVRLGPRVVFVEDVTRPILVRGSAIIEAAAVIGGGVEIGQGALVRAGAVVLRSVPPNAIVEGNPAQVVGYCSDPESGSRPTITNKDHSDFTGMTAPAVIDLGVGDGAMYLMRRVVDARGGLTVGEVAKELPFAPARYFLVFDVPSSELRGEHAHRQCHQFLICVHGSCRVLLDDGDRRCEVTLDRPDLGVYMPPMIWGTQYRYSRDAVLLVFASHGYDAADYLRTYDDFTSARHKAHS
ncbi:isomerase [Roseovarius spongiae]|uniref:Isomerase n=1 Tax=Roseovarius spongiae TaxID=2320272 RepID=A0A3A8B3M9_9RHOB|nr:WxcM-like domain-containing protein [Roseovarius spongiae]RKF12374.1 isomerase [Roseovarius spongiae]